MELQFRAYFQDSGIEFRCGYSTDWTTSHPAIHYWDSNGGQSYLLRGEHGDEDKEKSMIVAIPQIRQ
jgi:hypothetical protein